MKEPAALLARTAAFAFCPAHQAQCVVITPSFAEIEPRPRVFGDPVLLDWCSSASQASLRPVLDFATDTSLPLTTVELISLSAVPSPVPSTQ